MNRVENFLKNKGDVANKSKNVDEAKHLGRGKKKGGRSKNSKGVESSVSSEEFLDKKGDDANK